MVSRLNIEPFNTELYGENRSNPNSYAYTNPLYDYSYGQVRDAATRRSNVNSEEEVKRIIDRFRI